MHKYIKAYQDGESMEDYYIVDAVQKRIKKDGGIFYSFSLKDKSGSMPGICWNDSFGVISTGDVANISATVKIGKQEKPEATVSSFRKIEKPSDEMLSELVKSAPASAESMYNTIIKYVENIVKNEDMKKLTLALLEENKDSLMTYPAAISFHHAEIGGLLNHTSTMIRSAYAISQIYKYLNLDLLICGAALHDIGKIEENKQNASGLLVAHTIDGELMGHLVIGAFKVREKGKELGVSEEVIRLLSHMLLSHHGKLEFGSPVVPKFPEALVLNAVDELDAKLYEMEDALGKTKVGELSDKVFAFDNARLYRSELTGIAEEFEQE